MAYGNHYFDDRSKAEQYIDFCWRIPYELRNNEACRPTYKIVKVPNKSLWRVSVTYHHYGPRDFKFWVSVKDYQFFLEHKSLVLGDDEPETRPENVIGNTFPEFG